MPVPNATSVSMLAVPWRASRHAFTKNRRPKPNSTTPVNAIMIQLPNGIFIQNIPIITTGTERMADQIVSVFSRL